MKPRIRRIVAAMLAMALGPQPAMLAMTQSTHVLAGVFVAAAGKAKQDNKQDGVDNDSVAATFGLTEAKYKKLKSRLIELKDPKTNAKKKKTLRSQLDDIDKNWRTKFRDNPEFIESIRGIEPESAPAPAPSDAVTPSSLAPDMIAKDPATTDKVSGLNLAEVTYSNIYPPEHIRATFVHVGAKNWNRMFTVGTVESSYVEVGRDASSVRLLQDSGDQKGKIEFTVDLDAMTVNIGHPSGDSMAFGNIIGGKSAGGVALAVPEVEAKPAAPTPVARAGTFEMTFVNEGDLPLKLFEASASAVGREVNVIMGGTSIKQPVKYGDHFVAIPWELLENKKADGAGHHPPIFIADDKPGTIILHGQIPYNDFKNAGNPPLTPDYDFNITGLDIRELNPGNLVESLTKSAPVFERLKGDTVDYVQQAGRNFVKFGFTYSASTHGVSTKGTKLTSDYNNFSRNVNASIGGTVKGVSAGIGLKSSFSENKKSGQVYGFNRNVEANYVVGVVPTDAELSQRFRVDVMAMDPNALIAKYGTHYPTEITYGSDVMSYMIMSTSAYDKAQSFGLDIKATISKSQEQQVGRSANRELIAAGDGKGGGKLTDSTQYASREVASGEIGFGFDESTSSGANLSDTKGKTRWIGTSSDPAPVKIQIDALYNLLTPQIFKDGVDRGALAQKRAALKAAIDGIISAMPNAGEPLPEAKVYSVALDSIEIVDEFDDANKDMKGKITLVVAGAPERVLWEEREWRRDIDFRQGKVHRFPTLKRQFFTIHPDNQGRFPVVNIQAFGKIHERDDLGADPEDIMDGQAVIPMQLGMHDFEAEYYAFAHRNKVKIRLEIKEEPQAFADLAGG